MIVEVTMYGCQCDNCKQIFVSKNTGLGYSTDDSEMEDRSKDEGWITSEDGEHYCKKCHTVNEDGKIIVNKENGIKTAAYWFKKLPAQYRFAAYKYTNKKLLECEFKSIKEALCGSFDWNKTNEGVAFWQKAVNEL